MPLQSQLFSGDLKLEAAAVSDSAHIVPGAIGEHVRKIQLALIQVNGASLSPDGVYRGATAAAVLAYKQRRGIVNRTYQTTADNIVGKMTMAALDLEMAAQENKPAELQSLSPPPISKGDYIVDKHVGPAKLGPFFQAELSVFLKSQRPR
jgi:peptidoglycan hydrolase-like protein with peptidoglycan-binding domain